MSIYPWGETTPPARPTFNLPDSAAVRGPLARVPRAGHAAGAERRARTTRPPRSAPPDARRGARPAPASAARRATSICPAVRARTRRRSPTRCDDTAYGKGKGGELTYEVKLPRSGAHHRVVRRRRLRVRRRAAPAPSSRTLLDDPGARAAREARASARRSPRHTQLDLPGDRLLAARRRVEQAEPRRLRAGGARPRAARGQRRQELPGARRPRWRRRASSAPASPTTRGCSPPTASTPPSRPSRSASSSRSRSTCGRSEASIKLNDSRGKVVHEVITDGPVYFGANADAGNTDETAKFPSAVALVWRWTGDDAFRDEMYDFAKSNLRVHLPRARRRRRRLARGSRQRRAGRHGRGEARQHDGTRCAACATSRTSPKSKGDTATATWAGDKAADLEARFEQRVVDGQRSRSTPTRSTTRATSRSSSATGSA